MSGSDSPPKSEDLEKHTRVDERTLNNFGQEDSSGDLQVFSTSDSGSLKTTTDGKTVLIPQPSDHPDDPLNWSFVSIPIGLSEAASGLTCALLQKKKHMVLASFVFASLVGDPLTNIRRTTR